MSVLLNYITRGNLSLGEQFFKAALVGDIKKAEELLRQDPLVANFQDEATQITALMIFASNGAYPMVDQICATAQADVSLEDARGRTALEMAYTVGRLDIFDRIMQRMTENIEAREEAANVEAETQAKSKILRFPKRDVGPKP